jgi:hypothetical protein
MCENYLTAPGGRKIFREWVGQSERRQAVWTKKKLASLCRCDTGAEAVETRVQKVAVAPSGTQSDSVYFTRLSMSGADSPAEFTSGSA